MGEAEEVRVIIDPSVLTERITTYSSLTDLNGIPLFTDEYEQLEYQRKMVDTHDKYKELLFIGTRNTQVEEDIMGRLFTVELVETYGVYRQDSEKNIFNFEFLVLLMILVVGGGLGYLYQLRKKGMTGRKGQTKTPQSLIGGTDDKNYL
ncbi:MAG: hypothetical protein R3Y54_05945 [Eubacteriales bacterium]